MDTLFVAFTETYLFKMSVLFVATPASLYGLYKSRDIWHSPNVCYAAGITLLVISYLVELRTETTLNAYYSIIGVLFILVGLFIQGVRRMAIEDYKKLKSRREN